MRPIAPADLSGGGPGLAASGAVAAGAALVVLAAWIWSSPVRARRPRLARAVVMVLLAVAPVSAEVVVPIFS